MQLFSRSLSTAVLLLACVTPFAWAQTQAAPASAAASPSLYAVNAAALATAMTWCSATHGGLTQGSPGADCFSRARGVLAGFGLRERAAAIDAACTDPASFNNCITPHIGRLVHALNDELRLRLG